MSWVRPNCCLLFSHLAVSNFSTLWTAPGFPVLHYPLEFAQTHVHHIGLPSSHLIQWCPLLTLMSFFPSIRDFSNESAVHIRWPKYQNFNFSISSSNECSGLISLKINWFDLFAVQGTLTSLLQHHSSKASIFTFTETSTEDSNKCPKIAQVISKW